MAFRASAYKVCSRAGLGKSQCWFQEGSWRLCGNAACINCCFGANSVISVQPFREKAPARAAAFTLAWGLPRGSGNAWLRSGHGAVSSSLSWVIQTLGPVLLPLQTSSLLQLFLAGSGEEHRPRAVKCDGFKANQPQTAPRHS